MFKTINAIALLFLAGCATSPEAYFKSDIKMVEADQLSDYWVEYDSTKRVDLPSDFEHPSVCGRVDLKYIIDSNGRIFNADVVHSAPAGVYDYLALKAHAQRKFKRSAANLERVPVQVVQKTIFKLERQDCSMIEAG